MNSREYFQIVSIVAFFLLGIIWTKRDLFNLVIKISYFGMALWGSWYFVVEAAARYGR